jgi:hypothetical protein
VRLHEPRRAFDEEEYPVTETPSITVYGVMSPNVLKVVILLEELALPYRLR